MLGKRFGSGKDGEQWLSGCNESLMTSPFTDSEQNWSCQGQDDGLFSEATAGGDSTVAEAREVIAVGAGHLFDEVELTQSSQGR